MSERTAEVLYPARLVARRREVRRARAVRVRRVALALVTLLSLTYGAWSLAHSRLFALDGVEITGASHVTRAQVLQTGRIRLGMNMLSIDVAAIERRLVSIPFIASARVERLYPSKLRIVVTERIPVAALEMPDATWVLDEGGVALALAGSAPARLEVVRFRSGDTVTLGRTVDPAALAGLAVWDAVPRALRSRVVAVDVSDPTDAVLWLGAVRVDLGDTSRLGDKFSALGAILGTAHARSLVSVNLTAPARPAARYA